MAKYRKRAIEIEAVRWRGYHNNLGVTAEAPDQPTEITAENMHGVKWEPLPAWLPPVSIGDAGNNPSIVKPGEIYRSEDTLYIGTLEGVMRCEGGDWIIQGVKGELYPCKADIFAATYEAAPDVLTTKRGPGELAETILDIARGAR